MPTRTQALARVGISMIWPLESCSSGSPTSSAIIFPCDAIVWRNYAQGNGLGITCGAKASHFAFGTGDAKMSVAP